MLPGMEGGIIALIALKSKLETEKTKIVTLKWRILQPPMLWIKYLITDVVHASITAYSVNTTIMACVVVEDKGTKVLASKKDLVATKSDQPEQNSEATICSNVLFDSTLAGATGEFDQPAHSNLGDEQILEQLEPE